MGQRTRQDNNHRVRELEGRVAALTRELEALRSQKRINGAHGRRIGDPLPKPPPPAGRAWTMRTVLLLLLVTIGASVLTNNALRDVNFRDLASIVRFLKDTRGDYVLLGCIASSVVAVSMYRWRAMAFAFFGIATVYPAFEHYLTRPVTALPVSERTYVWAAYGLLVAWHTLVSILCIMESRKLGRGRGRSALVGTINSAAFYPIAWHGLHLYGSSHAGLVYACLGVTAVLLAVYAESSGPHRNYLFQIYIGSALLLFNFAINTVLAGSWFLAALAVECLVLAALHHVTGIVILKAANVVLLLITFVLTTQAMKFTGTLYVGNRALHSNWVHCLFAVGMFLIASWYYATHIRGVKPQHRKLSGHWFMADTMFDVPPSTVSLLHAAGAALLLMLLMISDLGNLPSLPFMLAVSSAALALIGVVLRTAQIEVAAVMLVIAAHVSFYFFLYVHKDGFREQPLFSLWTALLAAYTFFGGFRCERFLARISAGRSSEHHVSASLPYMVAVGSTVVIIHQYAGMAFTPLYVALLAILLAIAGAWLRAPGLKIGAVAALCAASGIWFSVLLNVAPAFQQLRQMWYTAAALAISCIAVERIFPLRRQGGITPGPLERFAQMIALALAAGTGAVTLAIAADPDWRSVLLFAHAFLWIFLCVIIRETEYRWIALLTLAGSALWLFLRQRMTGPGTSVAGVAASTGVFLAILGAVWFLVPGRKYRDTARVVAGK